MDHATLQALARQAGLEKALAEYPDDVAAAAAQAETHRAVIQVPEDPTVEPWPPMQPGATL
jgi:hypothetical protein